MSKESLALLLACLSFVSAIITIWRCRSWCHYNNIDSNVLNHRLNRISNASHQQYYSLREHMDELLELMMDILQKLPISDKDIFVEYITDYKNKTTIRLRKMEVASPYSEFQREGLLYFAGSKDGKLDHVVDYIRSLCDNGLIDGSNINLALRIIDKHSK
jgi:hypothetical protein